MLARPAGAGVHHPTLRHARSTGFGAVAARPGNRSRGPAPRVRASIDWCIEAEEPRPARAHAHFGQVTKSAAVAAEQCVSLRRRYGHSYRIEHGVLTTRVRQEFPAALTQKQLLYGDAVANLDIARQRSQQRIHAGYA